MCDSLNQVALPTFRGGCGGSSAFRSAVPQDVSGGVVFLIQRIRTEVPARLRAAMAIGLKCRRLLLQRAIPLQRPSLTQNVASISPRLAPIEVLPISASRKAARAHGDSPYPDYLAWEAAQPTRYALPAAAWGEAVPKTVAAARACPNAAWCRAGHRSDFGTEHLDALATINTLTFVHSVRCGLHEIRFHRTLFWFQLRFETRRYAGNLAVSSLIAKR